MGDTVGCSPLRRVATGKSGETLHRGGEQTRVAVVVSHPIQHFAPLYRELAAQGEVDLRVFFCCDWGVRAYHDPAFGREVEWDVPLLDGYAHEFLSTRRRPREISFREVDNPDVGVRLSKYSPGVVIIHGYACRTMWRAVLWAQRKGALTLLSSDSNVQASPALWKRPAKRLVVGAFYRLLDGALAVGDNNRRYHEQYGMPAERILPAVLPVDGRRLALSVPRPDDARRGLRARLGIADEAFVPLFCGNLTSWKRPQDFVRAVSTAAEEDSRIRGLVVGEGPERPALERLNARASAAPTVLAGFVNQSEIGAYYAAADVLVLASERDAHPLVVTEALFFGLPIVISDRVGCIGEHDTARPGTNSRTFACGDVKALASLLVELASDEAERLRLGRASMQLSKEYDASTAARTLNRSVTRLVALGCRRPRRAAPRRTADA